GGAPPDPFSSLSETLGRLELGPASLEGARALPSLLAPSVFLPSSFWSLLSFEGWRSDLVSPFAGAESALVSLSTLASWSLGKAVGEAGARPLAAVAVVPGVTETGLTIVPPGPGKPNSTRPRKVITCEFDVCRSKLVIKSVPRTPATAAGVFT